MKVVNMNNDMSLTDMSLKVLTAIRTTIMQADSTMTCRLGKYGEDEEGSSWMWGLLINSSIEEDVEILFTVDKNENDDVSLIAFATVKGGISITISKVIDRYNKMHVPALISILYTLMQLLRTKVFTEQDLEKEAAMSATAEEAMKLVMSFKKGFNS
jgi:hypothetical protein